MDMDSTLINEEGIDLLAERAGVGEQVELLTREAMAGKLDFKDSLQRRTALLGGQPSALLQDVSKSLTFTNGALELISTLHSHGWRIGVVSGGFHQIIDPILDSLNLDFVRANNLEVIAGTLSGAVHEPIIGPLEKALALEEFAAMHGVALSETVAIGDGANDRDMLTRAGLGVAFCAKAALKECADLIIDQRDLRILLESV